MAKNSKFSVLLKSLRKKHGFTQATIASHLSISRAAYGHYESGLNEPDTQALTKLAGLFDVAIETLIYALVEGREQKIETTKKSMTDPSRILREDPFFSEFYNSEEGSNKYKNLDFKEKEILYYYNQLPKREKEDFMLFLKIKAYQLSKTS